MLKALKQKLEEFTDTSDVHESMIISETEKAIEACNTLIDFLNLS